MYIKEYVIQPKDVGKRGMTPVKETCQCCGRSSVTFPFEPLGKVQTQDVGKICKMTKKGIWYVENNEQFEARKSRINGYK